MRGNYIVALDQGTSSCRAFAVDGNGVVCGQKSEKFSPIRRAKGLSEYSAEELLQTQIKVLQKLLDEIGPQQVAGIGVCSQRSTVVLWDQHTGRAVAPVLTWEDGRAQQQSDQAPLSQPQVHTLTGLFKTPYFSAPKIAWCLENCALAQEVLSAGTLLAAPVASYLIWHLTNGAVLATDPTLAQRTLLWNIHTGQWSEELCEAFGVPKACLPRMQPSAADYGTYLYKGVNIPICVCVADQQAAAFYHGLSAGKTAVNYGTGAFVLHHTGGQLLVLPGMLSSVAVTRNAQEREFLLEGPVFAAGSVLEWLKMQGIVFEVGHLDTLCATAKNPIRFLPALGGLGAPYWDYSVRPQTENLSSHTTPADWVAGALQGIAGRVADIVYYLRGNGQPLSSPLYVSGGLARSKYLLGKQADLTGMALQLQPETENTVLGTALLTAEKLGWNVDNWRHTSGRTITPHLTEQQAWQAYQTWQQFVTRCRNIHG